MIKYGKIHNGLIKNMMGVVLTSVTKYVFSRHMCSYCCDVQKTSFVDGIVSKYMHSKLNENRLCKSDGINVV